ncbi:hypothetical protein BJ912DRAFT_173014 [Pholiota molesta]|nr:hypothetical protein BJ912DRAFT_173014 [Pholiota molesta]
MFAFLSRLRLTSSAPAHEDTADDASSLNRSLNLPWPVTESSTRRPAISTTTARAPASGPPSMTISYPIPRAVANSLTGLDEYIGPSGGTGVPTGATYGGAAHRPSRAQPPQVAGGSNAWYDPEKPRRLGDRPPVQAATQATYAPPAVVRLDSEAFIPVGSDDENEEDTSPPRYSSHRNISTDVVSQESYPYSGYVTAPASVVSNIPGTAQRPPTRRSDSRPDVLHSDHEEHDDGGELYTSPFDSDSDEGFYFPVPPRSTSTASLSSASKSTNGNGSTMPKSRWALKLQLHNAQSMPSLQTGAGSSTRHFSHPAQSQARPPPVDQRLTHPSHGAPPLGLAPGAQPAAVSVDTDVYKQAYNYPLAKQLSPIAEQDYFSPVLESSSRAASLRYARGKNASSSTGKASPGAESLGELGAALLHGAPAEDTAAAEVGEKESLKTRTGSVRTGSGGSIGTINGNMVSLSRAGSASMGQLNGSPSEITLVIQI